MDVDSLIENFRCFDDWEDRYSYLIDLGRKLEPLSEGDITEENKVDGCISQVWLVGRLIDGKPPRVEIRADRDAFIVKGLIAILLTVYSNKTPRQILAT
ncbi:MAG: SufE family protein, partial [Gammaproteobacteria bacterium]|nr:SufE family protein [Gammaproteobacteria bacterium]